MTLTRVPVAPGRWLAPAPAASYLRMRAAGCPAGITSAGRTTAEQRELYEDWLAGRGAFALPPGTSRHESGHALDLPRAASAWMEHHGGAHGWRRTNPNEWWHWEHFATHDTHRDDQPAPATPPTAPTHQETEMIITYGTKARLLSGGLLAGIEWSDVESFRKAGVPVVAVSSKSFESARNAFVPR